MNNGVKPSLNPKGRWREWRRDGLHVRPTSPGRLMPIHHETSQSWVRGGMMHGGMRAISSWRASAWPVHTAYSLSDRKQSGADGFYQQQTTRHSLYEDATNCNTTLEKVSRMRSTEYLYVGMCGMWHCGSLRRNPRNLLSCINNRISLPLPRQVRENSPPTSLPYILQIEEEEWLDI